MVRTASLVILLVSAATPVLGQEYDFAVESKYVNIAFESKGDVEDILGTARAISGTARVSPGSASFELTVPVDLLRTGIDLRDEHLRSEFWLDAKKNPHISFKGTSIKAIGRQKYEVAGTFSMHGVEKPLRLTVEAIRVPKERAVKAGMKEANWLRVRTEFKVKLSDFNVEIPAIAEGKVNDEWTVRVSLYAMERSE